LKVSVNIRYTKKQQQNRFHSSAAPIIILTNT
jgi:hypothetical protein